MSTTVPTMLDGIQDWAVGVDWDSAVLTGVIIWVLAALRAAWVRHRERVAALESRNHSEAVERQRRLDDQEALRIRTAEDRSDAAITAALGRLHSLLRIDSETWDGHEDQIDEEFDQLWRLREQIRDTEARDAIELVVEVHSYLGEVSTRAQMGGGLWTIRRTCAHSAEVLAAVQRVQPPPEEPVDVHVYREVLENIQARERQLERQHAQKHAARRAVDPSAWPPHRGMDAGRG